MKHLLAENYNRFFGNKLSEALPKYTLETISPEHIVGLFKTLDNETAEVQRPISLVNDWNPPYNDTTLYRFLFVYKQFPGIKRRNMDNVTLAKLVNKAMKKQEADNMKPSKSAGRDTPQAIFKRRGGL